MSRIGEVKEQSHNVKGEQEVKGGGSTGRRRGCRLQDGEAEFLFSERDSVWRKTVFAVAF